MRNLTLNLTALKNNKDSLDYLIENLTERDILFNANIDNCSTIVTICNVNNETIEYISIMCAIDGRCDILQIIIKSLLQKEA